MSTRDESPNQIDNLTAIKGFLYELLDPDVFGYLCSDEVKDKARQLLHLPGAHDERPAVDYEIVAEPIGKLDEVPTLNALSA